MTKKAYTIPCASQFRDDVLALANRRGVNAGDIARSVLLVVPIDDIRDYPDPGEPTASDREVVILKSGSAKGRPWRRKPRLQVRMAAGYDPVTLRRALAIALAMARGETGVRLEAADEPVMELTPESIDDGSAEADEELIRLRAMVSVLSFDPLEDGVRTRDEALHVLGLPPGRMPDQSTLRARFRMLATIHHPDGELGDHRRMSQLNSAMEVLRGQAY